MNLAKPTESPRPAGPAEPIPVGLLGATGMVGQQFVRQLDAHPWFRLAWLGASDRSAGRSYGEATRWVQDRRMPGDVAGMVVRAGAPAADCPRLVFSAMHASVAGPGALRFDRRIHAGGAVRSGPDSTRNIGNHAQG